MELDGILIERDSAGRRLEALVCVGRIPERIGLGRSNRVPIDDDGTRYMLDSRGRKGFGGARQIVARQRGIARTFEPEVTPERTACVDSVARGQDRAKAIGGTQPRERGRRNDQLERRCRRKRALRAVGKERAAVRI